MSLSKKGFLTNDTKLNLPSKATTLNPNAAEFVPFTLRSSSSPSGSTSNTADGATKFTTGTVGRAVLDRSESSVSNASDDEAHQFWRHQLPDDITPDFKVMSEDESQGLGGLSLAGLSLHDSEVHRFNASSRSGYVLAEQQETSPHHINGGSFSENMRYAAASYGEDPSSASFLNLPTKPWDKQIANSDHLLGNGREVHSYNGNSRHGFNSEILGEHAIVDDTEINPLEFLASQFPGFATESLAEVYFANGCDLNLTIEMLTQLELQVDGSFNQNTNTKTLSAPSLSALDFPALTVLDNQNDSSKYNGDDLQQASIPYRSSNKDNMLLFKPGGSFSSRGAVDFASAVRKLASQDSSMWKHVRNGSADSTVGSSRSSHVLPSAYGGGHGRSIYADRQSRGSGRQAPVWLETGEAVANMYSEMREEARDHARLRNVYFEQARQAYLIGNKALAKELSAKGQLHNMHMKEAHGKAQESIYHQRNPASLEMQGAGRGHEQMIDLHGLHVTEAIHVLKQELSVLRSTARAADQRLQVYICVGTGHHTRGSRTPARLPVAVQRYLLEEEGLDYTEPHPGLLRVVIY
ncbi:POLYADENYLATE-BINDING PROTEIN-INTERACTING PROTEIN 7 [Salix viminalis]|uniref:POLYADENYLATE-BINDING PROTEIN-INTERACTING PROTEIN 7 n=1 Tax=Salix viminalis TaxID=40686 RepID=A0A9Q0ZQZ3_SALVM|nr:POLYADENYLATE-BINDING PROTEIN-INTERACTING PROTEIN 7 [Salix viminalis]KAJ6743337.1 POLYADENYLATE-BINDING PROTEIN-INTERACTING PROTEIN 7 [Salix viminalis]